MFFLPQTTEIHSFLTNHFKCWTMWTNFHDNVTKPKSCGIVAISYNILALFLLRKNYVANLWQRQTNWNPKLSAMTDDQMLASSRRGDYNWFFLLTSLLVLCPVRSATPQTTLCRWSVKRRPWPRFELGQSIEAGALITLFSSVERKLGSNYKRHRFDPIL